MDQREHQIQSLGICKRLFNFIMRNLAQHAFKSVTLGTSQHGQMVHPLPQPLTPSSNGHGGDGKEVQGDLSATSVPLPQPKAPKKTVSINDKVEEITDTNINKKKNKNKKRKQTQKLNSLDLELEEEEEPKPLKSILKVGSKLNDSSNSFAYQSTN